MSQYSSKEVEHIVKDAIARERERCADIAQKTAKNLFPPSEWALAMSICGIVANEIRKVREA